MAVKNLHAIRTLLEKYDQNKSIWSTDKQLHHLLLIKNEVDYWADMYGDLKALYSQLSKANRNLLSYVRRTSLEDIAAEHLTESVAQPLDEIASDLMEGIRDLDKATTPREVHDALYMIRGFALRGLFLLLERRGMKPERVPGLISATPKQWLDHLEQYLSAIEARDLPTLHKLMSISLSIETIDLDRDIIKLIS